MYAPVEFGGGVGGGWWGVASRQSASAGQYCWGGEVNPCLCDKRWLNAIGATPVLS